jgi:hypothetical protein
MKPPVWGKAIGIIMICLGSLGIFLQLYKFMIRSFSEISHNFNNGNAVLGGIFRMSEAQATGMLILALIGLLACVFYIVGGAKLLKATPENYNFGKYSILAMLSYNAICLTWMLMNSQNIMIYALAIYVAIGLALDIALFIVFIKSDSSGYLNGGVKTNDSILDGSDDDFDFE